MNRLPTSERATVIGCLVEGRSIRSTVRITGVAKNTVVKLLVELGGGCAVRHDKPIGKINGRRVQVDDIWSLLGCREGHLPEGRHQFGAATFGPGRLLILTRS